MSKIWINEMELSWWSYVYCLDVEDNPKIRNLITDSGCAYLYYKNINKIPLIKQHITDPYHIKMLNMMKN